MRLIYGGKDPRELPAYTVGDAALYLRLNRATLKRWTIGKDRVIRAAGEYLSFNNLVEAHVLAALRTDHGFSMPHIRRSLKYIQSQLDSDRPLLQEEFETDGVALFVEKFGKLHNTSQNGQIAMRALIEKHLQRIERDDRGLAARFFPLSPASDARRLVVIDPRVQFGRPVLEGTGIRIDAVAARFKRGESITELADDYGCEATKIEEAVRMVGSLAA